jgi:hypothetical protein
MVEEIFCTARLESLLVGHYENQRAMIPRSGAV